MEEIMFGIVLKNRSFPFGEGDGGWGQFGSDKNVQEYDARDDE
jgi:hypothetical protein